MTEEQGTARERLNRLSEQEFTIYKRVNNLGGSAEEINRYLQQEGFFEQYRQIHSEYVELTKYKVDRYVRNEALKRAIFLGWYHELEPAPFTGLADLSEEKLTEAYFALNRIIEKGWMNEELEWMLAHYAQCDWIMLQHTENKIHAATRWIRALAPGTPALPVGQLVRGSMDNRGLMGLYFKALGVEQA